MKLRTLFCSTLVCCLAFVAAQCATRPVRGSASGNPSLAEAGDGHPTDRRRQAVPGFGGELTNNSATSVEYMKPIWPKLVEAKLNTVLAAVSWNQIEPQEGKFDFSVLDGVIRDARSHNLHLVLLWFASWKNGLSSYPPDWVKRDFERFPRAQIARRQEHRTAQPPQRCQPRRRCPRLCGPDAARQGSGWPAAHGHHDPGGERSGNAGGLPRPLARGQSGFRGPVPKELMDYLQQHKDTLIPEFRQVWEAAGFKTSGTWEEVFGKSAGDGWDLHGLELCALHRPGGRGGQSRIPDADVRERGAVQNSAIADVAATNANRRTFAVGGPMADLHGRLESRGAAQSICSRPTLTATTTSWRFAPSTPGPGTRCSYPRIWAGRTARPECSTSSDAMMRSVGRVMGLEDPRIPHPDNDLIASFDLIAQLAPLIAEHQGNGTMSAVLLRGPNDPPQKIQVGNYTLEVTFYRMPKMTGVPPPPGTPAPRGGNFHCDGAGRVLRGWQRRNRHFFSEHTGAPARRTGDRGRRRFCERPLGSRAPAERRRQR